MQRVSDIEGEPIVGKYYLVPCVADDDGEWWPIVGALHDDAEILNFPLEHYHKDARFLTAKQMRYRRWSPTANNNSDLLIAVYAASEHSDVEWKRRQCQRVMPTFPLVLNTASGRRGIGWFGKLEQAYADKTLPACMTCPHRGMPLKNLPVKDGKIICNGHGLQWDAQTGKLVSRLGTGDTV